MARVKMRERATGGGRKEKRRRENAGEGGRGRERAGGVDHLELCERLGVQDAAAAVGIRLPKVLGGLGVQLLWLVHQFAQLERATPMKFW